MRDNLGKSLLALAALTLLVNAAAVGRTFSVQAVGAQGEETLKQSQRRTWEYSAISEVREIGRGGKFSGFAKICYFKASGCQEAVVEGADARDVLAKSIAKLGDDGWEMVEESPLELRQTGETALYFKRAKR